ncbi:hypothetical protein RclHR1_13010003 [Rhizophagus clarus]|uniref:MIR domain-containing protein n=1 Tax=Rhizophagus clarus TaxID=94130 RepID=A0A2Z6Q921_9GLOM|nr:hypothetical protein RclHR1_13010003 [Rhizophagus clarus]GES94972.1 hypothetical protein GLOIN_2v1767419 [Rhizophagus clarus]
MDVPVYDGNIHPYEWIINIQKYFELRKIDINDCLEIAIVSVNPTISLPAYIDSIEDLYNALKEDISFAIFKNTNKKMLKFLKYVPESKGGNTSTFISRFRKLCYNAEIIDIEEQKEYLYDSLPMNYLNSISIEFHKKMTNIDSYNKLIKEFEDFATYLSQLIVNESIVALKHVATGKYLGSINRLHYETGSKSQLVFVENPKPSPNSLWKIKFSSDRELASTNTSLTLQHVRSGCFLGISYRKSPSTKHTEVNCSGRNNNWNFKFSKLENHQGYLKSNDIINLSIKKLYNDNGDYIPDGQAEYLRGHDIQFTVRDDAFQEVFCHNEILGGNDEWCIELIEQHTSYCI